MSDRCNFKNEQGFIFSMIRDIVILITPLTQFSSKNDNKNDCVFQKSSMA